MTAVADLGFSPGGGANSQKCYYFSILSQKTAWKWKNLGPQGGRASLVPPLDPPMDRNLAKISQKLRIKWNFELTVFESTVPDLY